MFAFLGLSLVFAAAFGGFVLEGRNPWVLMQPAELLIVGGAASGILLVANSPSVILKMVRGAQAAFRAPRHTRQSFIRHLRMLYEVFAFGQRAGLLRLEEDVEDPENSRMFSNYPNS